MYLAVNKGNILGQFFTSENIHHKLLSLVNIAVYLLNKMFVGLVIVATAPELCQNCDFFPEKRLKEIFAYYKAKISFILFFRKKITFLA